MQYLMAGSLLSIIIVAAGWLTIFYNRMTSLRMRVDTSQAHLYMQYAEKNDLIQAITELVSEHVNQEQGTRLKEAIAPTSAYFADTPLTAVIQSFWNQSIHLETLLQLSEFHPEIEANEAFIQIKKDLQELEQQTQLYRQFYIEAVLVYNNFLSRFPNNIPAMILGIRELPHSLPDNDPNPVSTK